MNPLIRIALRSMARNVLIGGALLTALMLACSPVRADFDAKASPELVLYAIGQFNGVYARVGDNAQVRISFEDTLYLTTNKDGLDGTQVIDVNQFDGSITFLADDGAGLQTNTLQRMSDGIVWTHGDGSQSLMYYVRRLTMPDSVVIACNAYTVQRRDRVLAKHPGTSCT